MSKIINTVIILIIFSSVSCTEPLRNKKTSFKEVEKMNLKFNFYPSSGGSVIYTIDYSNDSLYIKKLRPEENEATEFKKHLTEDEIKSIKQAVSKLKKRENVETDIILDAWRVELIIDGVIYYNKSGVNLKTLPADIKNLLSLLIENSTVKIDLYGFS